MKKALKSVPMGSLVVHELITSVSAEKAFEPLNIRFPHNKELEQAVLGAAILYRSDFHVVKNALPKAAFYFEKHQTLYGAMSQLSERADPIDLLTVAEEIKSMGLLFNQDTLESLAGRRKEHYLLFAVNGAEITECTSTIGSDAHLEYHCRILYELYMRRKAIAEGWWAMKHAQDLTFDVFDLYDYLEREIRITHPQRAIRIQDMNEVMEEGEKEPPARWMCGNLVKENEVCILFGDEGTGKSILAFQMADAVSRGRPLFPKKDFENHCEAKLTIFYDFELDSSELYTRYSFQKKKYSFHGNFKRGSLNPDFLDFENADELIINEIQREIEVSKPGFVIVDNITYITSESQDPLIATRLMKKLLALQRKHKPLTILVIAHTPKRDLSLPIENRHLAGAKNLPNFAKSVIAVNHSKKDTDKRYIKHTKCRNGRKLHDENNVIECLLIKEGVMLQYEYLCTGSELSHLIVKDTSEMEEEALVWAEKEYGKKGNSYRNLVEKVNDRYNFDWSHTTLRRKLLERKNGQLEPSEK